MEKIEFSHLGEEMFHEVLENGLNVFVFPKPEFQKGYAFWDCRMKVPPISARLSMEQF